MIHPMSNLPLASKHRVSQIKFHPSLPYLAVQSHDRSVEIFRIRTEEEVKKKVARRKKRAKEKKQSESKSTKNQSQEFGEDPDDAMHESQLVDYFSPHIVVRASGKVRSFDFDPKEASLKGGMKVRLNLYTSESSLIHLLEALCCTLEQCA